MASGGDHYVLIGDVKVSTAISGLQTVVAAQAVPRLPTVAHAQGIAGHPAVAQAHAVAAHPTVAEAQGVPAHPTVVERQGVSGVAGLSTMGASDGESFSKGTENKPFFKQSVAGRLAYDDERSSSKVTEKRRSPKRLSPDSSTDKDHEGSQTATKRRNLHQGSFKSEDLLAISDLTVDAEGTLKKLYSEVSALKRNLSLYGNSANFEGVVNKRSRLPEVVAESPKEQPIRIYNALRNLSKLKNKEVRIVNREVRLDNRIVNHEVRLDNRIVNREVRLDNRIVNREVRLDNREIRLDKREVRADQRDAHYEKKEFSLLERKRELDRLWDRYSPLLSGSGPAGFGKEDKSVAGFGKEDKSVAGLGKEDKNVAEIRKEDKAVAGLGKEVSGSSKNDVTRTDTITKVTEAFGKAEKIVDIAEKIIRIPEGVEKIGSSAKDNRSKLQAFLAMVGTAAVAVANQAIRDFARGLGGDEFGGGGGDEFGGGGSGDDSVGDSVGGGGGGGDGDDSVGDSGGGGDHSVGDSGGGGGGGGGARDDSAD